MTTYFISHDNIDNVKTFRRLASLAKIIKPGDIIEILPGEYGDDILECNGSPTSSITIKCEGKLEGVHLKGQYIDVTINCDRLYLTNCMNLSLMNCNINYIHAYNVAKTTFFKINGDLIDISNGTENVISECVVKDINIDCCNLSLVTYNTSEIIMLTGNDSEYELGFVNNNKCNNIMVNNGIIRE